MKDYNRTLEALYAIETNQHNSQDSDNSFGSDNEEKRAIRKISATEEIPNEVKNWLTETFIRGNVIKNLGKFEPGCPDVSADVFLPSMLFQSFSAVLQFSHGSRNMKTDPIVLHTLSDQLYLVQ